MSDNFLPAAIISIRTLLKSLLYWPNLRRNICHKQKYYRPYYTRVFSMPWNALFTCIDSSHGHKKNGPQTEKWPSIHSYGNYSVAQGNIEERFSSASRAPRHALVRDVPDAEIFLFSSLVSIGASQMSTLALFTDHGSIS